MSKLEAIATFGRWMRFMLAQFEATPCAILCSVFFFGTLLVGSSGSNVALASEPVLIVASSESESDSLQASKLNRIADLDSRFERKLALYEALKNADEGDLDYYFDQLQTIESDTFRFEVESLVVEKWATLDPAAILSKVDGSPERRYRELVQVVLDEWMETDFTAALEFASKWSHHKKQILFETSILHREDLSRSEKMQVAQQLGIEFIANSLIERELESAPIVDAEKYWRSFAEANRNHFRDPHPRHRQKIAESLVAEMGTDAFLLVDETVPNFNDKMYILPLVVNELAKVSPRDAFELLRNRKLRPGGPGMLWNVVTIWAMEEPIDAFEAVTGIENGKKRMSMQAAVLDRWAMQGDPREILEFASGLPDESRSMAQEKALVALASTAPEEALELSQHVQDLTRRERLENSIATSWAQIDLDSALAWVRSEPTVQHKRFELMSDIVGGLARTDFDTAWETALAEPVDEFGIGLEASLMCPIRPLPADVAPRVLDQMRNEQTKLAAMLSIGAGFLQMGDKESIDSAWNLSKQLESEDDRHRYLKSLVLAWVLYGQEQDLYNRLDRFPTQDLKKHAAQMLKNNESENFTERQLQRIESYLVDE